MRAMIAGIFFCGSFESCTVSRANPNAQQVLNKSTDWTERPAIVFEDRNHMKGLQRVHAKMDLKHFSVKHAKI